MLEALESFGPAQLLRTSFVLYPLLNAVHILAIGTLVTTAALMDLRILGLGRGVAVEAVVAHLRPVAVAALAVAALSGFLLFTVQAVDYAANPAFQIKMLLLVLAVANALAFTSFRAHRHPGRIAAAMAALSLGLWLSVAWRAASSAFSPEPEVTP